MKAKIIEWFRRYFLAWLLAVIAAVIFANGAKILTGNVIVAGIAGTWGDNLAFYGIMIAKEANYRIKKDAQSRAKFGFRSVAKIGRNLIIEFGPAEYLDSFLLRPIYLSVIPLLVPNYSLAIIIGTILADVTFFVPTIISYELRTKYLKD